jgi:ribonuclease HI
VNYAREYFIWKKIFRVYNIKNNVKKLELYIDGASKGNPGPSGVGVVICQNGEVIKNLSSYIGEATNNIAEYTSLIYALQEALILKAEAVKINTDSQLLYRQIKKEYKVKNPHILSLYTQVKHLFSAFSESQVNFIPRENNRGADKLASLAIKKVLARKQSKSSIDNSG